MAIATGRKAEEAKYRELGAKLRETFQKAFIKDDGTIGNGSQASYVFAFAAGMVPELTHARGEYGSVYGKIVTDWKMESSSRFVLDVVIPANTRATEFLPDLPNSRVTENGQGVGVQKQPGWNVLTVGAGTLPL